MGNIAYLCFKFDNFGKYMLNIVQCDTQGSFENHHQHQSYITTLKASPKSSIGLNRKYIIFEIFQEQSN